MAAARARACDCGTQLLYLGGWRPTYVGNHTVRVARERRRTQRYARAPSHLERNELADVDGGARAGLEERALVAPLGSARRERRAVREASLSLVAVSRSASAWLQLQ